MICILVFAGLFIALHILVNLKGKSLLENNLQQLLNRKVYIGRLSTSWPLNVRVYDLRIEGICGIEEVFLIPGAYDIFNRVFKLSSVEIIKPEISLEQTPDGLITYRSKASEGNQQPAQPKVARKKEDIKPVRLAIDQILIKEGSFDFIDTKTSKQKIKISARNFNLKLENLILGRLVSQITSFSISSDLPWDDVKEKGTVDVEGWLNLKKKDMQAKVSIEDIDGIAFYPYYEKWVDLENTRIKKAKLNFSADLNSVSNDMTVTYRIELTDIEFKPRSPDEEEHKAEKIAHAVIGIFKNLNQGKIVLEQTFKTKMDNPEFGFDIIRKAFEDKLSEGRNNFDPQEVLILPSKLIEGTFKGITGAASAFINGAIGAGKEIGRVVQDSLKKEDYSNQTGK